MDMDHEQAVEAIIARGIVECGNRRVYPHNCVLTRWLVAFVAGRMDSPFDLIERDTTHDLVRRNMAGEVFTTLEKFKTRKAANIALVTAYIAEVTCCAPKAFTRTHRAAVTPPALGT